MHSWRRQRQSEHQANLKKFLDRGKESVKRLKALKLGLEKSSATEVKQFFTEHYCDIFYVVYTSFTTLETNIQDKLAKNKGYYEVYSKELLELVLPLLRQVLISLPELIHKKWQFNSICLMLRKLLHPKNHMKLRYYGMQLLLLWVQALQENAGDSCMELFASAVPFFPPQKTPMGLPLSTSTTNPSPSGGLGERYGVYSTGELSLESLVSWGKVESQYRHSSPISSVNLLSREVVRPNFLIPLIPSGSEQPRPSLTPTEELMTCLLECLSRHAHWLHWDDPRQSLRGFAHLFFLFKLFYLACLYKDFQKDAGLYTSPLPPTLEFSSTSKDSSHCSTSDSLHSVLEEPSPQDKPRPDLAPPTLASSGTSTSSIRSKHKKVNPYRVSSVIKLEYDLSNPVYSKVKNLILKYVLMWFHAGSQQQHKGGTDMLGGHWPPVPSILPEAQSPSGAELVRKMWFTSRDNVSLLLEICRQGFSHISPISQTRNVVDLYRHWYQSTEKPPFMQSPPVQTVGQPSSSSSTTSPSPDSREALVQPGRRSPSMPEGSAPSVLSWEQLSRYKGFKVEGVEAGLNASIAMIMSHTQQVFDFDPDTGQDIAAQAELCRKVIRLCQDMVVGSILDRATWDFLLSILLYHTWSIFTRKDPSLARELAAPLLKTLLVCFLRASGSVEVRSELWDNLLHVLQSLTHWQEVITQWKDAMRSMTEVLAQAVYGLSLQDLPLDVMSAAPHRRRVHSMERQGLTSTKQPVIRQDRRNLLSGAFSDISIIQQVPRTRSQGSRRQTVDVVKLTPQQQQPGQGDGKFQTSPASTACLVQGGLNSIKESSGQGLTLVEEEEGARELKEVTNSRKDAGNSSEVVMPVQIEGVLDSGTNKGVEVIANPNVNSPIPNLTRTPGASQESLEQGDIDSLPAQPLLLSTPEGHSSKRSLRSAAANLLKHRSPEARRFKKAKINFDQFPEEDSGRGSLTKYSPLLSQDDSYERTGGRNRKKKKTGHKRSGSDTTSHMVTKEASPSSLVKSTKVCQDGDKEGSSEQVAVSGGTPAGVRRNVRKTLSIPKSASEGNIHLISMEPFQGLSDDSIGPFRRVATIGSPRGMSETSSVQDLPVGVEPSMPMSGANMSMSVPVGGHGGQGKPIFERSMTVDSPEQEKSMWMEDHAHVPPPISPTFGGGYSSSGWQREVAAITWLRMLKILGNMNKIRDDHIHAEAIEAIMEIWNELAKIQANSGISINTDEPTPPLPKYMPPCELFLPWVVQACTPPPFPSPSSSRLQGRRIAYQLLCEMTITHWHTPPSLAHLAHFYRLLHIALQSDMAAVAVKHGCHLYSYGLPGSSVLLPDCVEACEAILSSRNSMAPRSESLFMMGSLLYLPHLPHALPSSTSSRLASPDNKGLDVDKLRERIVRIVYGAAVRERSRIARCVALYQVGILVFSELWTNNCSENLQEGLNILLSSLKFMDRGVSMCAIDMVSMLSEVAPQITTLYPSLPSRIVQAICYALAVFLVEEVIRGSWIEKVIITLLFLLRDWLMVLPFLPADTSSSSTSSSPSLASTSAPPPPPPPQLPLPASTIRTVFEVLQAATCSERLLLGQTFTVNDPIGKDVDIEPLETSGSRVSLGSRQGRFSYDKKSLGEPTPNTGVVKLSWDKLKKSSHLFKEGRIQTAARSVVTHLLNLLGHFPFGCGAAQMGSSIKEYHDCPSLLHLDDLSPEIFDSPRIQFFSFGEEAVVTLVEIPTKLEGVPTEVKAGQYQTRVIVRDVTGKYAWDSSLLYGPLRSPFQGDTTSMTAADSFDSLVESVEVANCDTPAPLESWGASQADPLMPPSWRTHVNSDRDVLQDLLEHVEQTSPECSLVDDKGHSVNRGVGHGFLGDEITFLRMLSTQDASENKYNLEAIAQPCMLGEKSSAPPYDSHNMAFHHCRVFLSHLGLLSWDKRCHLDLLDKTSQLILELKNLDQLMAQSRATYKVAVLYVAPGQEDKASILSNSSGSRYYEEFVAGLGWEVDMETHAGYMAGMQREFASCSMPYYATSSEEVLFHVATRMKSKMEQKVRHLGNDEVHIVWSEHWRDYRRSLFRTQFADVLIILYPLPNGLIRVQMDKKSNVPQFGPLFSGAVVSRDTVAPLVRATAINALRAQRTPLVGYRGRYEERLRYIQNITRNIKKRSTYEVFCENVMHPLEMGSSHTLPTNYSLLASQASPHKVASTMPTVSLSSLLRSAALKSQPSQHSSLASRHLHSLTGSHSPSNLSTSRLGESLTAQVTRPRSSTNEERLHQTPESHTRSSPQPWTTSVPDNLHNLTVIPHNMRSNTTPDLHASPRGSRKKVLSHSLLKPQT